MDNDSRTRSDKGPSTMRRGILLLVPAVALLIASSTFSSPVHASSYGMQARALQASSQADLEMITSWEPSEPSRFNPYTGSLLAPFMIPRVSGTANNTRVQEFILDYFAKLNETSLAGVEMHNKPIDAGDKDKDQKKQTKKKRLIQEREKLFQRAPGTVGTGWHLEKDTFVDQTPYGPRTFTNLIFTKNPRAENRLVLAAHFDSKYFPPKGQKPPSEWNGGDDTEPFVAATDSAVPCAILLDVATSLDRALDQPGRTDKDTTLQIVFFDGEEAFAEWTATDSLYGSRHLANKWAKQTVPRTRTATGRNGGSTSNNLEGIELMVLLDLLGTEKPEIRSYFSTTQWAHRHTMSIEQRLWDAKLHGAQILSKKRASGNSGIDARAGELDGEEQSEEDMDQLEPEEPVQGFLSGENSYGGIDDDHRPFLEKGVPIFHVIPYPFPHVWHELSDNADAISQEVVEGWANIFRTFTVEYLHLLRTKEHTRDEL
ncbi:hypothetical protein EC968_000766 [Mortierella alpina]|nr:hypothetical protein EC968_000766 [Mortierella alpina]